MHRAWSSIRDSNVSTLITCAILFWFGDQFGASLVKGFALTLALGVIISMFSAILVTRTFLRLVISIPWLRRPGAVGSQTADQDWRSAEREVGEPLHGRCELMFDFVGKRNLYYLLSLLVLIPGVISLLIPPALKPGIEFSSGTTFTARFQNEVKEEQLALRTGQPRSPAKPESSVPARTSS